MKYCAAGGRSQRCLNYEWGVQGAGMLKAYGFSSVWQLAVTGHRSPPHPLAHQCVFYRELALATHARLTARQKWSKMDPLLLCRSRAHAPPLLITLARLPGGPGSAFSFPTFATRKGGSFFACHYAGGPYD